MRVALAIVAVLSTFALYAMWAALHTDRPGPGVPRLSATIWYLGWALAWACVLLLAGGIVGLGARVVWRVMG